MKKNHNKQGAVINYREEVSSVMDGQGSPLQRGKTISWDLKGEEKLSVLCRGKSIPVSGNSMCKSHEVGLSLTCWKNSPCLPLNPQSVYIFLWGLPLILILVIISHSHSHVWWMSKFLRARIESNLCVPLQCLAQYCAQIRCSVTIFWIP